MDIKDYRKKAKALGGKITTKTVSFGTVIGICNNNNINICSGNCWSKDFYDNNTDFFNLHSEMKDRKSVV